MIEQQPRSNGSIHRQRRKGELSPQVKILLAAILALLIASCASVDFDYPREPSYAFDDTASTSLGRQVHIASRNSAKGDSGFLLLRDGTDSLAMRLQLVRRAERSVDVQVYEFKADRVGGTLIHHLLQAADRGVRVRLLLDDTTTQGYDAGLSGLDSHPNIEVRVFNPFKRGAGGRSLGAMTEIARLNRRMHNKSFIVDNQVAVMGGRNLSEEYYNASEAARFSDLDVLALGSVVTRASAMFDEYWNHQTALPLPAFADMPDDSASELQRVRDKFAAAHEGAGETPHAAVVRGREFAFQDLEQSRLSWVPYRLVYDSPDKGMVQRRRFRELRERGVEITIVTNSLASQDQLLVHTGYAPSRGELLRMGIRLYEFSPQPLSLIDEDGEGQKQKITLHTKSFIVDRQEIFVGSFNFDPRSAYLNTECGLILESPDLAGQFAGVVENALTRRTYELFLAEDGDVHWKYRNEGGEVILDEEPHTTQAERTKAYLGRMLPIEGHL
jgi:putative cardiolipin synthase